MDLLGLFFAGCDFAGACFFGRGFAAALTLDDELLLGAGLEGEVALLAVVALSVEVEGEDVEEDFGAVSA